MRACLRQALLRHISQAAQSSRQQRRLRGDAAAIPCAVGLSKNGRHSFQEDPGRIDMCICTAAELHVSNTQISSCMVSPF